MLFNWNKNSLKSGIYQIRNLINGKVYIGSAKRFKERGKAHLRSLKQNKHHNKHLQGAFNKDGSNNFVFEVLEVVDGDKLTRTRREQQYLDQYFDKWDRCYNVSQKTIQIQSPWSSKPEETRQKMRIAAIKRMANLVTRQQILENLAIGQKIGGNKDKKTSKETREKISKALKGRKNSLKSRDAASKRLKELWQDSEYRKQMHLIHKGKILSEEQKNLLLKANVGRLAWNKGKTLSTETKEKISNAKFGKGGKKYFLLNPLGEIIIITNLAEHCRVYGLSYDNMRLVVSGKRNSHKKWKHANNQILVEE